MSKYRRDIDGMRAIAVMIVVLFHAHIPGFSGGFIGVDVFFVLSGFLITGIIVKDLDAGRFSILRFFERRARRILPAVFTMMGLTTVAATFILIPPDLEDYAWSMVSAAVYISNVFFWRSAGYFDGPAETKPLLHTWSLSVEEQFYFVTPFVLMAAARWAGKRYLLALMPFAVVSLGLASWGAVAAPSSTFYLLPTRFWELLAGSFLALGAVPPLRSGVLRQTVAIGGLAAIALPTFLYTDQTPFPGMAALAPCLGTVALLHSGDGAQTGVSRLLSTRPFTLIGLVSYSLYLWHWPVLVLGAYVAFRALTIPESLGLIAVSFGMAWASYRFVEQRFRTPPSHGYSGAGPFLASGAAMAVASGLSAVLLLTGGLAFRYPDFTAEVIPGKEEYNEGTCFLKRDQGPQAWSAESCTLTGTTGPRVLLWGDSYGAHYAPGLTRLADEIDAQIVQHTASACPPVLDYSKSSRPHCRAVNDHAWSLLESGAYDSVVLAARWEALSDDDLLMDKLGDTITRIRNRGITVYLLGQSPIFEHDVQSLLARSGTAPQVTAIAHTSIAAQTNKTLRLRAWDVEFVDPTPAFCTEERCRYREGGAYLFRDPGHLSTVGSELAVRAYFPFVR